MAQHVSVGARPFASALMLQKYAATSKHAEVDTNEFGLMQSTLRFALANDQWPAKQPTRGTPCSSFLGDTLSMGFLNGISFMGAQTCRWTPSGKCAGIGILEVMCQGAKFNPAYESGAVTPYFATVTTTLQDLTFSIYDTPLVGVTSSPTPPTVNYGALVATTANLPATYNAASRRLTGLSATISIDGTKTPGGPVAGTTGFGLAHGNLVLVKNQAAATQNGLYKFETQGTSSLSPWTMVRADVLEFSNQFTNGVQIAVQDGLTQKGTVWQMVLPLGVFVLDSSPLGFVNTAGGSGSTTPAPALVPLYNIHLLYHSIDLHFEYMAAQRQQDLRYIKDEYSVDSTGLVDIGGGLFQQLSVERAEAQKPQSSSPTVWAGAPDSIWQAAVHYPGTAARLEQTPAGPFWHVLETATVKIEALLPGITSVA